MTAASTPDNLAVITRVINRGATIPTEDLVHIFDPFRRGLAGQAAGTGLGLGLYIVQQIALAHGAGCTVTSADGVTTFEITWPRVPIERLPDRDA